MDRRPYFTFIIPYIYSFLSTSSSNVYSLPLLIYFHVSFLGPSPGQATSYLGYSFINILVVYRDTNDVLFIRYLQTPDRQIRVHRKRSKSSQKRWSQKHINFVDRLPLGLCSERLSSSDRLNLESPVFLVYGLSSQDQSLV